MADLTQQGSGEPGRNNLAALALILIFAAVCIGVFHTSTGDVAAMTVALGGLFHDWRGGRS